MKLILQVLTQFLFTSRRKTQNKLAAYWVKNHKYVEFAFSGRIAIYHILTNNPFKRNKVVLIPEYICNVVNLACIKAGYTFIEYEQNDNLKPNLEQIIELLQVHKPDAIIFASVYGSDFLANELLSDKSLRDTIRLNNTLIIYDLCQNALLINSEIGAQDLSYVAVGSFNDKVIPGIMGAVICSNLKFVQLENRIDFKKSYILFRWLLRKTISPSQITNKKPIDSEFEFSVCKDFPYDFSQEAASHLQLAYASVLLKNSLDEILIKRFLNLYSLKSTIERLPFQEKSPFIVSNQSINGLILKKPYAQWNDRNNSKRPSLIIYNNLSAINSEQLFSVFSFSGYTNALSIQKGLSLIGIELKVKTKKGMSFLKESENHTKPGDVLLFTDEFSLKSFYGLKDDYFFSPKDIDFKLIDDKVLFANFLIKIGEKPVLHYNDFDSIVYPCYLKSRNSWIGSERLPKGVIVCNREELNLALNKFEKKGFQSHLFFYQKLLYDSIKTNISVSGYYDRENSINSLIIVTSKIKSARDNNFSTGAMVTTIPDHFNLKRRTENILFHLQYTGPFELEFYFDSDDQEYKVLELNPRFWMQHGIFIYGIDNLLIKKYLGLVDNQPCNINSDLLKIIWVDGSMFFEKFPRFSFWSDLFFILKMKLNGFKIIIAPDFRNWLSFALKFKFRRN
jgi:hypothetical protein